MIRSIRIIAISDARFQVCLDSDYNPLESILNISDSDRFYWFRFRFRFQQKTDQFWLWNRNRASMITIKRSLLRNAGLVTTCCPGRKSQTLTMFSFRSSQSATKHFCKWNKALFQWHSLMTRKWHYSKGSSTAQLMYFTSEHQLWL